MGAREVTAHGDAEPRAGPAAGLFGELEGHPVEDDDVILADGAVFFMAENVVEVHRAQGHTGAGGVGGGPGEGGVIVWNEVVAQTLAASSAVIPATRSSLTRRSCKVRFRRSPRPRACGE